MTQNIILIAMCPTNIFEIFLKMTECFELSIGFLRLIHVQGVGGIRGRLRWNTPLGAAIRLSKC